KDGIPADGKNKAFMPSDAKRTKFPSTVRIPSPSERVLKDGAMNQKIGGDVLVGRLKGAPIFTLTLEERATCPKSCLHWRSCYGNGMSQAHRFAHGPALTERLTAEIEELMAEHARILIRLHVLGDFYDPEYVEFWRNQLFLHPGLHIFGFTAWAPHTDIGRKIAALRGAMPERFAVRNSGACAPWGSFTIDFPTERKQIGDAIVCPAQLDANNGTPRKVHCGNCAACWSAPNPIVFVEH
ncbi:MAG: hypothetical protein AAFZ46_09285, partial [Pseudomonadota bacterium]